MTETPTTTTTTPTTADIRRAYLQQLQAALTDLGAEVRGHSQLRVQGLDVYIESDYIANVARVLAVSFRTGYARREGRHRYMKVDVPHIAKAVRRVVEEQAKADAARKAYLRREEERQAREEAVSKPIEALVERINVRSCAARYGRLVKAEVSEHDTATGTRVYRWELQLMGGLSETQVRDILKIVDEGRPWEGDKA